MIPQNLKDIEHFRSDPRVQFKEEIIGGVEVVIPCYMIADASFWDLPYARELRGHTYRKDTGELIGVAFHKFFNVGEREETQFDKINWNNVVDYTFDKMDGSMINAVVLFSKDRITAEVFFKTKKSFYSDVALEFTKWFWEQPKADEWADGIVELAENGFSPIFEFFHPEWQIVINYGEPHMWWLNTRYWDNGKYYDGITNNPLPDMPKAPMEIWDVKADMADRQQTVEGVEGWIVYDHAKNELYKVKTKWYLQQHKVRTQMRERDVAELAALEKLDDVKSLVSDAGLDLSKIEVIEKSVSDDIGSIRRNVEFCVDQTAWEEVRGRKITAKEMADMYKNHVLFGIIMTKFRGKEPNYVDYFLRNILKVKYGLKNVYNEKF